MKKFYVLTLLLYCFSIIAAPEEVDFQAQRSAYRNQFDEDLAIRRMEENTKIFKDKKAQAILQAQREREDLDLNLQRAKEDGDQNAISKLRLEENRMIKNRRIKEDKDDGIVISAIKNWWSRDGQRREEDITLKTKRDQEDKELQKPKESIKIKDITANDVAKIYRTAQQLDHILIDQEFKKVISKLVDIESYQKVYHDLSLGRVDIESLQKVQQSLKGNIKLSPDDLKIIEKKQKEIGNVLKQINSLFDTNNPIYKKIENQLKTQQPPATIQDLTSNLEKSIKQLQKIDFNSFFDPKMRGWYALKECAIACIATPFVSAALGAYGGAIVGGALGTVAAGIGAVPGVIIGAIGGSILSGYVGIYAAPFVAVARLAEAYTHYQYTIDRDSFQHSAGESREAKIVPGKLLDKAHESLASNTSWMFKNY
ncbi:MAG TPA: hypothetical protein VLG50_08785 [Candidatus Saccharimonadales bacterium]|nr:hypothetical protein [Candidatus Saccharimonadales bacterium]